MRVVAASLDVDCVDCKVCRAGYSMYSGACPYADPWYFKIYCIIYAVVLQYAGEIKKGVSGRLVVCPGSFDG
jgi:hypothetical protein